MYLYKYKEDAFKGYGIFHSRLQTLIKESGLVSVNFLSYESYWQEKGKVMLAFIYIHFFWILASNPTFFFSYGRVFSSLLRRK